MQGHKFLACMNKILLKHIFTYHQLNLNLPTVFCVSIWEYELPYSGW
jgi:hypothetical protein